MTRMDGMSTLRCIKKNPRTECTPVMMLTADLDSVEEAVRLGAAYHVAKPISETNLTAYLKEVLPEPPSATAS